MKSEVRELLTEELKDAYSAEKQALRCMQKALRKASAPPLRDGIQLHIEQTQVQIERAEIERRGGVSAADHVDKCVGVQIEAQRTGR